MGDTEILPYRTHWVQKFAQLEELLNEGKFHPPLLHHCLLLVFPTIAALLIPCRYTSYMPHIRGLAFLWTEYFGIWIMQTCRSPTLGNGYGIGILVSVFVMRSGTMLLLQDPERSFKHVEHVSQSSMKEQTLAKEIGLRSGAGALGTCEDQQLYICQGYPQGFLHRLSWVLSLLLSPRGSRWSWRIKTSMSLPEPLLKEMRKEQPRLVDMRKYMERTGSHVTDRLWKANRELAKDLVWAIFLALIARNDPYFWGEIQAEWRISQGWVFPASSFLTRAYRFLICWHLLKAICIVLYSFRVVMLSVFASVFSSVPQPEDWMIPHLFGPFSSVYDHGLVGFWGLYWHQVLRFDFLTWSRWILSLLPVRYQKVREVKLCIYLLIPFSLTGVIHACGSYTQFNDTNRPETFVFLALVHAVGIGMQQILSSVILPKCPGAVRKPTVFITTCAWLYVTGITCCDDGLQGGFLASFFITCFTDWRAGRSSQPLPFMGIWRGRSLWQSGIRIL